MKATRCILILSALLATGSVSAQQKKTQSTTGTAVKSQTGSRELKNTAKLTAATGWNMVRQARETTCLKVLQADGSYQQEAWYVYPAAQK